MEDTAAVAAYGLLYNGRVVLDEQGIAPEGWRVPTNDDWKELLIYFGIDTTTRLPETTTEKRPPGGMFLICLLFSFWWVLLLMHFRRGRFYDGRYAGRGQSGILVVQVHRIIRPTPGSADWRMRIKVSAL